MYTHTLSLSLSLSIRYLKLRERANYAKVLYNMFSTNHVCSKIYISLPNVPFAL